MADRRVTRKGVELITDDLEWFSKNYPSGSLNWTIQLLFSEFRRVHEYSPKELAAIGAAALKAKLDTAFSAVKDHNTETEEKDDDSSE